MRMTALALVAALVAVVPAPAAAQAEFGLIGGFARTTVTGGEAAPADNGHNGLGGFVASIPVMGRLALRPEALITAIGAQASLPANGGMVTTRLHYAAFPVLAE